jgi:serine/threonine protein kinase
LKPANVIFAKGKYKLADFGFSKKLVDFSKEEMKSSLGTPIFSSL